MNSFKSYALQEFARTDFAAAEFKFTYSCNTKLASRGGVRSDRLDKASSIPVIKNAINVKVSIVDRDMKQLDSKSFKFINNELTTTCKNKLVNIAPAEITNKFVAALPEIANVINNEISEHINTLQQQLSSLHSYAYHNSTVIPDQFRGESIQVQNADQKYFEF